MLIWGVRQVLAGEGKFYSWGVWHLLPGDVGFSGDGKR
jgi:hypothetical protein